MDQPIKTVRLSERIIEAVRLMIIEDNFSPGDKFYSENELTKKLKVSRASIREAIRILEIRGQVTVKQGKGIYITEAGTPGFESFSLWLKNNSEDLFDQFDLRMILDPKAAARAAINASGQDIKELEDICKEFSEGIGLKNNRDLVIADTRFHIRLAKSTGNRTLYSLMKTMGDNLNEGWISSLGIPGRIEKTNNEHQAILYAVRKKDPIRAEAAMYEHLNNALKDIRQFMEKSE